MQQALYQAAILTFEELLFAFPVEDTDETVMDDADCAKVAVTFQGPFSGELVLQIENQVLSVVASNMLGVDEPVSEEMRNDILGEIANIICGNALPAIAGKQEIFRLNAPEFHGVTDPLIQPSVKARLGLEEGRAEISLFLN